MLYPHLQMRWTLDFLIYLSDAFPSSGNEFQAHLYDMVVFSL